jgi:alpha-amylase
MHNSLRKPDGQKLVNLYFQVHQPRRLNTYGFFDIGSGKSYFDDALNGRIVRRVAHDCYLPANRMLLDLIKKYPALRITFSISGTSIDQFRQFAPQVLDSFRNLSDTGAVEFLGETRYHSLASVWNSNEFKAQVIEHLDLMEEYFGCRPSFFRNTELILNDDIAEAVDELGLKGIMAEGSCKLLGSREPDQLYLHEGSGIAMLPRNFQLSDDIAFRFADVTWDGWPLTADKFMTSLLDGTSHGKLTCLGLDYETIGEHHKGDKGIFHFFESLLTHLVQSPEMRMVNPGEALVLLDPASELPYAETISWADSDKDLSAWLGNEMQRDAFRSVNRLLPAIQASGNRELLKAHRYLQTSDHYYYMSTKANADGAVHSYFSPYPSPYEAFMTFMNITADLERRIGALQKTHTPTVTKKRVPLPVLEY